MNQTLPSIEESLIILKSHNASKHVITHSLAVQEVANQIATYFPKADKELISIGALLHDLGRTQTHGLEHAIKGAELATQLKLPEPLINIIERHMGAGISPQEAEKMGLPKKDYRPQSLEEKIVAHADNLIDKGKKQPIAKEVNKALKNNKKLLAYNLLKLHLELSELAGIDLDDI